MLPLRRATGSLEWKEGIFSLYNVQVVYYRKYHTLKNVSK